MTETPLCRHSAVRSGRVKSAMTDGRRFRVAPLVEPSTSSRRLVVPSHRGLYHWTREAVTDSIPPALKLGHSPMHARPRARVVRDERGAGGRRRRSRPGQTQGASGTDRTDRANGKNVTHAMRRTHGSSGAMWRLFRWSACGARLPAAARPERARSEPWAGAGRSG